MRNRLRITLASIVLACTLGCPLGGPNDHYRPHGHHNTTLSISPDGKTILFNAAGDGGRDLYMLHLPERSVTRIAKTVDYEVEPEFSVDGGRIVFAAGVPGDRADHVFVMKSDGTARTQLTFIDANDTAPCFSPDGKLIVFARDKTYVWGGLAANWEPGGVICVIGVDGKGEKQLTPDDQFAFNPSFSPDGRTIRYFTMDGVFELPVEGAAAAKKIGNVPGDAVILPDDRVVFSDGRFSGERELFLAGLDGKDRIQLTNSELGSYAPVANADGTRIYFMRVEWPSGPTGEPKSSVWWVSVDGGAAQPLTDCRLFDAPIKWRPSP